MTENKNESNMCKINPTHVYLPIVQEVLDEEGSSRTIEFCGNCEEEKLEQMWENYIDATPVDTSEKFSEYAKEKAKTAEKIEIGTMPKIDKIKNYDFIEKYSSIFGEYTNAPLEACIAMVEFDISVSLCRLRYSNGRGELSPNLGFVWLAPSGSYKTPLYDWGITYPYKYMFNHLGYKHFKRIGGRSLISAIANLKEEDLVDKRALAMITLDEASTLAKDSNADGLSDTFEAFAQAYDGQLASSHTIQRKSEYPHQSYSPIWFQGTPVFLKYINEDFWDIGLGNRMFFVPYSKAEIKPIPEVLESKKIYEEFFDDINLFSELRIALFNKPAFQKYSEYEMSVRQEIQKVQTDLESAIDSNNFAIVSKVKIPSHMIKLSIIFAASRFNIKDDVLWVDAEDVERAIKEVEKYHANLVYVHKIWENQSAQRLKHESIEVLANKIFNHIKHLYNNGNGYKIVYSNIEELEGYVATDGEGKWVKHSDLLKNSHMKAKGPKSFDEIMTTLVERNQIFRREAFIPEKGNKKIGKKMNFYAINPNEVS